MTIQPWEGVEYDEKETAPFMGAVDLQGMKFVFYTPGWLVVYNVQSWNFPKKTKLFLKRINILKF